MPSYIIAYHGEIKTSETLEEGAAHMQQWKDWVTNLGDAVINPGSPIGPSKLVSPAGISDDNLPDAMSGFSVVKADTLDAALEMAKTCPYVEAGGTLRVAQLIEMGG